MTDPLTWQGDPTIIVYATRWALGRLGSHAPILVANTIRANHKNLPHGAREVLIRDITRWLDGPGATATRMDREPWVLALAALGVRRRAVRAETPIPPLPPAAAPGRRRTDHPRKAS